MSLVEKTVDVARLVKPREMHASADAAVLAVDLKSFLKITANRNLQVEVSQRPIGEVDRDEPAMRTDNVRAVERAGLVIGPPRNRAVSTM